MQPHISFSDNLICYAISGRNYEIIHICEEKYSRRRALQFSINSNQHELTNYFIENLENENLQEEEKQEDDNSQQQQEGNNNLQEERDNNSQEEGNNNLQEERDNNSQEERVNNSQEEEGNNNSLEIEGNENNDDNIYDVLDENLLCMHWNAQTIISFFHV